MEFVGEVVTRPAAAVALRAAALNHEIRNHAVKNKAVVVRPLFLFAADGIFEFLRALGEAYEVFNGLRCFLFEQPANDIPQ